MPPPDRHRFGRRPRRSAGLGLVAQPAPPDNRGERRSARASLNYVARHLYRKDVPCSQPPPQAPPAP